MLALFQSVKLHVIGCSRQSEFEHDLDLLSENIS